MLLKYLIIITMAFTVLFGVDYDDVPVDSIECNILITNNNGNAVEDVSKIITYKTDELGTMYGDIHNEIFIISYFDVSELGDTEVSRLGLFAHTTKTMFGYKLTVIYNKPSGSMVNGFPEYNTHSVILETDEFNDFEEISITEYDKKTKLTYNIMLRKMGVVINNF